MTGAEAIIILAAKYGPSIVGVIKTILGAEKLTVEMLDALEAELVAGDVLIPKRPGTP